MDEKMEQMQDESGKLDIGILLHDFFRGFKKYWWIPAVLTVLVALYSFISSVRAYTPLYKSEASFTVTTSSSGNSNYSYQSVSYTHLDVYKRQDRDLWYHGGPTGYPRCGPRHGDPVQCMRHGGKARPHGAEYDTGSCPGERDRAEGQI